MVFLTLGAINGVGVHKISLTPEQAQKATLFGWVDQMLILMAIIPAKVAVVIFLARVQGYSDAKRLAYLWFLVISNMIVNLVTLPVILTQCSPLSKMWDDSIPGNCDGRRGTEIMGYFQGCEFPQAQQIVSTFHGFFIV
jgi:hypothetical protein